MTDNWRPGPETPRAHTYELAFCSDPNCGAHIVAYDDHHRPICEIVTTAAQTLALIGICQDGLYDKATRR